MPVGRAPSVAGYRHTEFSAEIGGKLPDLTVDTGLAEQRADTVSRPRAVLPRRAGMHVRAAELLPRHVACSLRTGPTQRSRILNLE